MDEQLYDEFGNYIGPELDDIDDDNSNQAHADTIEDEWNNNDSVDAPNSSNTNDRYADNVKAVTIQPNGIVIGHKQYYPEAGELYGDEVDITIGLEDTQPITTPIIQPIKQTKYSIYETKQPDTTYDYKYVAGLLDTPTLIRNIAMCGNLHSGKTSLCDVMIEKTHISLYDTFNNTRHNSKAVRYLDTQYSEQSREMTTKLTPITLLLPTVSGKHYVCNIVDTPGHMNFSDDVTAAFQLVDGAVVVVDAVEGCLMHTSNLIKHIIQYNLQFIVCINKIDRLITDLKLPLNDTYYKLQYIIDDINSVILSCNSAQHKPLNPCNGTVIFSSALHNWSFTLPSFAQLYIDQQIPTNNNKPSTITALQFANKLWGNQYFDTTTRKFTAQSIAPSQPRSFVQFVLEPIYKLYSHCLGSEGTELSLFLSSLHIHLTQSELNYDYHLLIKLVCTRFFIDCTGGLISSIVQYIPSPQHHAQQKINTVYSGTHDNDVYNSLTQCDGTSPVVVLNTCKAIARSDASQLDNLARVYSGRLHTGDTVRVLGSGYTLSDRDDSTVQTIGKIWLLQGRYRIELNRAVPGSIVLLEGIDHVVNKYATITSIDKSCNDVEPFNELQYMTQSTMKLILEPVIPSELPKMLYALRQINKLYPLCNTYVEENGEHVLLGTSELYMDCILYDIRHSFAQIDVRVTDPTTIFIETCSEPSSITAIAQTPNKHNTISVICEPLDPDLIRDLEYGSITQHNTTLLQSKYSWDTLSCRSIICIGPDSKPSNILVNDMIYDSNKQKRIFMSIYDSLISGFQWAIREGPLIEQSIRGCKFRIVDAELSNDPLHRIRGQLIPTVRRSLYTAFLLATPRLMEPIYIVEVLCQQSHIAILTKLLSRRRGHIISAVPLVGTPLYIVNGNIPLIDSFGLETDYRIYTHGTVYCTMTLSHWSIVPGDPLDKSVVLVPLEPAPLSCLAREFLIKTRRRKGLSSDINISSYIDNAMLNKLSQSNQQLNDYIQQYNMNIT